MSYKAAIFDLDGVVVDTAKFHYWGWRKLAQDLGFELSPEVNERLKGLSRMNSLDILLEKGGLRLDLQKKRQLAERKNIYYQEYLKQINETAILPGARELLHTLRELGVRIALASASKNAPMVIEELDLCSYFDVVCDGSMILNSKPDPEIFLLAASRLSMETSKCVVFEDAESGIIAAKTAGMFAVGIGDKAVLGAADKVVNNLGEFDAHFLF